MVMLDGVIGRDAGQKHFAAPAVSCQKMVGYAAAGDYLVRFHRMAVEFYRCSAGSFSHMNHIPFVAALVICHGDAAQYVVAHQPHMLFPCLAAVGTRSAENGDIPIRYAASVEFVNHDGDVDAG